MRQVRLVILMNKGMIAALKKQGVYHPKMDSEDMKDHGMDENKESMKLGGGGRFKALAKKVGSPALAAYIGRKKYGAKKFASLGRKGK